MEAKINITCDNEFALYLNDKLIGQSGNWKNGKNFILSVGDGDEILVKCKNRWGISGLVASIEVDNKILVTDESWQVSIDGKNWDKASIVGNYGMAPWGKRTPIKGQAKWIWYSTRTNDQTVFAKKIIQLSEKKIEKSTAKPVEKPYTKKEPVKKNDQEIELRLYDEWTSILEKVNKKLETAQKDEDLLRKFEKFITPYDPAVIAKVNDLGKDPKRCYQFVSKEIKYVTDDKNYGQSEFWCYPKETLEKGSGDCEDQAFLITSMMLYLGIDSFVRTAYLINYQGGHAWSYFKWNNEWLPAECTSESFDPWVADKRPQYGPYLPWIDIKQNETYNYSGLDLMKHAIRIKLHNYKDGVIPLEGPF